jgi:epoxyqueuosine reductase QueG
MIITDAELESTPLLEESVCSGCRGCADACPLGAISKTETEEITICGKTFTVGKINYEICKTCQNGAVANRFSANSVPDRIAALCNRSCMCSLEQRDALSNRFENPCRTSQVWSIGNATYSADTSSEKANVLGGVFSKSGNRGH